MSDNQSQIDMLETWKERLRKSQTGHYSVAEWNIALSTRLRVPLVLASALASTTVIASFYEPTHDYINWLAGILSLIATVLAALQSSMRVDDIANSHERVASKYGKLRRSIEAFIASAPSKENSIEFLKEIERRWEIIADDAPVTPSWARDKAKAKE